jgi:hypothetical protein
VAATGVTLRFRLCSARRQHVHAVFGAESEDGLRLAAVGGDAGAEALCEGGEDEDGFGHGEGGADADAGAEAEGDISEAVTTYVSSAWTS